jgi:hypothetical protein
MVEDERNKAAGRARVARDSLDMGEVNIKEAEQSALADQALADFAAAEGIVLDRQAAVPAAADPVAAPAAPAKTMGPAQSA